jgi:hypothetical protein
VNLFGERLAQPDQLTADDSYASKPATTSG